MAEKEGDYANQNNNIITSSTSAPPKSSRCTEMLYHGHSKE